MRRCYWLHKLDKKIAEETRWSHQGISARRKRNQGRLRELQVLRSQRARQAPSQMREMSMGKVKAETGGQVVLEARDISLSVGSPEQHSRQLVSHFNLKIMRGDRLGLVGPNGVGKSLWSKPCWENNPRTRAMSNQVTV